MANIAYPTSNHFLPERFEFGLRANVWATTSSHNGSTQTIEMPGSRWLATLSWDTPQESSLRAELEAFWANVRGQANRVQLWHIRRPTPRGTMQANTTFNLAAAIGSSSLRLANASAGQTLLAGDMIGHLPSNQIFMVTANATSASGSITVNVTPPTRVAIASGNTAVLVRPSANFMLTTNEVRIPYEGYNGAGFSVELVETYL